MARLTFCVPDPPPLLNRVLWQTVKTQMKCRIMRHFIRVYTVSKAKSTFREPVRKLIKHCLGIVFCLFVTPQYIQRIILNFMGNLKLNNLGLFKLYRFSFGHNWLVLILFGFIYTVSFVEWHHQFYDAVVAHLGRCTLYISSIWNDKLTMNFLRTDDSCIILFFSSIHH